ncbi:hypothetical protein QQS21_004418 [Conoideocrella luteorostrata]|uniref:carboxypeptidase C n=1 Tax=Conoideocrella luteorostrata TaxID=1105319 RepID=A0AAJ0CRI4_9HYPO|nr:hypothetical protein QQS21_004418 [Conoideocrella luteorostrata]
MFFSKLLTLTAAGVFASAVTGKLLLPAKVDMLGAPALSPFINQRSGQGGSPDGRINAREVDLLRLRNANSTGSYKAGEYTLKQQSDKTCATKGEKHWSGTIDVTDERRLFFWFFDSRNDPENDPIVLWLNGGPGSSSMVGLLTEVGACTLPAGKNITIPNEWAWNNNASLLVIDQPAGVGFSSVAPGGKVPDSDEDGAEDFQTFLNIFFMKVFPRRAQLPIHFAAESYGGHYAPTYMKYIMESRKFKSPSAFRGNITSLVLVNALYDHGSRALGTYELFCVDPNNRGILNETACDIVREDYAKCYRTRERCELAADPWECAGSAYGCERIMSLYEGYLYDIKKECIEPTCQEDNTVGNITAYLNQPNIISELGFPKDFQFEASKAQINRAYNVGGSVIRSMAADVGAVLDAYKRPGKIGDFRLLVLQGNDDYICNTPGNKIVFESLGWSGQANYRASKWAGLPGTIKHTGDWKGTKDGRLVFVSVDAAGHMVPSYQPEAAYRILDKWMRDGWRA